ncbi:glycosyltransferase family 9 protein [Myxococcota bacterium]|nr:glycosyltransferase family 9 protein [Myxococcota bacterium]
MSGPPILVLRLTALGDVVLVEPILRALRAHFPGAVIDLVTEARYVAIGRLTGADAVVPWDRRGEDAGLGGVARVLARLPRERYALVVDLQGKLRTRMLSARVPADRRVTLAKRTALGGLLALFGRDPPIDDRHATDVYAAALAPLGVALGDGDDARTPRLARLEPIELGAPSPATRWIGLSVGATHATKRWPIARFAALAEALHAADPALAFVPIGGPADRALVDELRRTAHVPFAPLDVATLDVEGLTRALAALRLLVSVDTGPAHVAAALGVPVVAIFGPTSPTRWGPRSPRSRVVTLGLDCSPCSNTGQEHCPVPARGHACLADLDVATVARAVEALLGGARGTR